MPSEPIKPVPGGVQRQSVRVDREQFPAILQRERLNQLLLAHDLHVPEGYRVDINEEDLALLRQIAREGTITNVEPAIRNNAILMLGNFPTVENINLLDDLAQHNEDFYVRSNALLALGKTGLRLVALILSEGLLSSETVESIAAEKALITLGQVVGLEAIRPFFEGERWERVHEKRERVITNLTSEKAPQQNHIKRETTRASDRGRSSSKKSDAE